MVFAVLLLVIGVVVFAVIIGAMLNSDKSRTDYARYAREGRLPEVSGDLAQDIQQGRISQGELKAIAADAEWYSLNHEPDGTPHGAIDDLLSDYDGDGEWDGFDGEPDDWF